MPDTTLIVDELSKRIIRSLIEVHKTLGPGLLESTYEQCLAQEFRLQNLSFEQQVPLPVVYKGKRVECGYRLDIVVEKCVILELKSVEALTKVHEAQLITYLKLAGLHHGFLVNFNAYRLVDGLKSILI